MANLSTYYPAPITATDLGLGAASNATFGSLTANNGTLTASAPVLDLGQTWNASGTTFTGLRFTVAETAAAIGSRYFSIDSGGTSIFSLQTRGAGNGSEVISISGPSRGLLFGPHGTATNTSFFTLRWQQNLAGLASNAIFAWGSDVYNLNYDLAIQRDAAHTLAQRIGTNPQTFNIYNTHTSATNHERGTLKWNANVFQIGTEKGSGGGTARALEFQTDGVTRFALSTAGVATFTATNTLTVTPNTTSTLVGGAAAVRLDAVRIAIATGGTDRLAFSGGGDAFFGSTLIWNWNSRTRFSSPADGQFLIQNSTGTDFNRIQFGGTTSSFPALKRSSTVLQSRLADDSDFAPLQGQLRTHANAVTETITADKTLTLYDAAGTAYKVPCVAA